ncbi:VWA domain-containing protein [Lysobacter sp. CA199]|uniref:VWA domain-containing protein n=1 Tax=Lysobacter sp. CA199 TaxID=3455608 RepID=UPI003F8D0D0C
MNPSSSADLFGHLAPLLWLRPQWLWALLALPALAWLWLRRGRLSNVWRGRVDAHLLPHLLESSSDRRSRIAAVAAALAYVVAVVALAGPSWSQSEQPLWQGRTPLVIALDLSSRTLAADLPPSRLAQAKAKLSSLLAQRSGGQIALVVYADDAYTVAPLTDDPRNLQVFLDSLAPDIMPGDGQRADRAIQWSARLLRQGGFARGQILLITDRADPRERRAADVAADQGYRVSVLGLGNSAGAPFQRPDGRIVMARLDVDSLRALAAEGKGRYEAITRDDSDLRALGVLAPDSAEVGARQGEKGLAREDDGYWLLPVLMLLALFAFRRRSGVAAVVVLCLWLPMAPGHAQSLWRRADQAAHERIEQGNQAYRAGRFEQAAGLYQRADGVDAQYNLGNALARQQQYPEAIQAYDRALKLQPGMADAIANKRAVEEAMKRKPPPSGEGQNDKSPKPNDDPSQSQKPSDDSKSKSASDKPDPDKGDPNKPSQPSKGDGEPNDAGQPPPTDPEAQRKADAAQREQMQRELERQAKESKAGPKGEREPARTPAQRERKLANDAWLKRVPDDPGALLREKFKIEYARRQMQQLKGD